MNWYDPATSTEAWSGQKPEEELRIIQESQASGDTVIFVGDGINDAPALAAARPTHLTKHNEQPHHQREAECFVECVGLTPIV